jgi:hypothetical protein
VRNSFFGWGPNTNPPDSLRPKPDPEKEQVFDDEIDPSERG